MSVDPDVAVGRSMAELMRLDGRMAVVTGGARGIGRAICARLAEAGACVVVADRKGAEEAAAQLVERYGVRTWGVPVDVTDPVAVNACADRAVALGGRIDVWVNNAGIFPRLDPVEVTPADADSVLQINVLGTQYGMAAAIRHMRADGGGGVVVNIASTAAFRGAGPYSASKWAVRGMTNGIAPEVGPEGIRVVAVAPTVTRTPGMSAWMADAASGDDVAARTAKAVPLGRMGEPDDTARMVAFLASDAAQFVTGVTVPVDGGSLAVVP